LFVLLQNFVAQPAVTLEDIKKAAADVKTGKNYDQAIAMAQEGLKSDEPHIVSAAVQVWELLFKKGKEQETIQTGQKGAQSSDNFFRSGAVTLFLSLVEKKLIKKNSEYYLVALNVAKNNENHWDGFVRGPAQELLKALEELPEEVGSKKTNITELQQALDRLKLTLTKLHDVLGTLGRSGSGMKTEVTNEDIKKLFGLFNTGDNNYDGVVKLLDSFDPDAQKKLMNSSYSHGGNQKSSMLYEAFREPHRYFNIAELLIKRGVDVNSPSSITPLYEACDGLGGDLRVRDVLLLLLGHGANPNIPNDNGALPLHAALKKYKYMLGKQAIDLLLKNENGLKLLKDKKYPELKANPDIENQKTSDPLPLVTAARLGELDLVKVLLNAGADPGKISTVGSSKGKTAIQIAEAHQTSANEKVYDEIITLMQAALSKKS